MHYGSPLARKKVINNAALNISLSFLISQLTSFEKDTRHNPALKSHRSLSCVCANYLASQSLKLLSHKSEPMPSSWVIVKVAHNYECSARYRRSVDSFFLSQTFTLSPASIGHLNIKWLTQEWESLSCYSVPLLWENSVQGGLSLKRLLLFIPCVHSVKRWTHPYEDQALGIKTGMFCSLTELTVWQWNASWNKHQIWGECSGCSLCSWESGRRSRSIVQSTLPLIHSQGIRIRITSMVKKKSGLEWRKEWEGLCLQVFSLDLHSNSQRW